MTWTHTVTGGPWPERIGLRRRIVPPPPNFVYPWYGALESEVVILIENDPCVLVPSNSWSCCTDRKHITPIQ